MPITSQDINSIKAALGPGGTNPLTDVQRGVTPTQTSQNNGYSSISAATQTPQGLTKPPVNAPNAPVTTANLSPAVITSKPAGQDLGKITADYQNIKTGVANQSAINKNTATVNNAVPSMDGYNVSANPNSGEGVISMKNNANGQTYYATPLTPPTPKVPSASDMVQQTQPVSPYDASLKQATTEEANSNNAYQSSTSQVSSEQQNAYNDFKAKVDQLTSGTFPLTGAQQALIDSTKASFDQAAEQANLRGAALSSETGGFSNKVSASLGEISSIDAQKAGVLASLENGFQTQDYNLIKDAYNAFTDLETKKTATIEKLHNDAVEHSNQIRTAVAQQQEADQKAQQEVASSYVGSLIVDPTLSLADKREKLAQAAASGVLPFDQIQKAQDELRKQEENPNHLATGIVGEYQYYSQQERDKGRSPMSFMDFKNYSTNATIAAGVNPITGQPITKGDQAATDEAKKQDTLDLQTVNGAYTNIEGILRKYKDAKGNPVTPDTFTKEIADQMPDVDVESIAKAVARIQNPDIARMGGDAGNALAPTSFSEKATQFARASLGGKQYLPEKVVDAVSSAKAIKNAHQSKVDNPLATEMSNNENAAEGVITDYVTNNPGQKEVIANLLEKPLPAFNNQPPTYLQALEYLRLKGLIK